MYQNSNAKSTKMAKIEVANTQLLVYIETFFCVSGTSCILLMRGFVCVAIDIFQYGRLVAKMEN